MFTSRFSAFSLRTAALVMLLIAGLTLRLATSPTLAAVALLGVLASLAALVVTFTFRGPPPPTVAETLYDVERLPPGAAARLAVRPVTHVDRD